MPKKILFVRTFRNVGAGGPVPPLGLLYLASSIRRSYNDAYHIKLIDTGIIGHEAGILKKEINDFEPRIIGISTISCEAELLHTVAYIAKNIDKNITVLAGGPYATVAYKFILEDRNIDYAVIGEGENTILDFLEKLENNQDMSKVKGISYLKNNRFIHNEPQDYIDNLDNLPFPAWDLVDFKKYAKYPNWNGNLKEKYYMPILTSRGCPYHCTYCHNTFGKKFRPRSAENVFAEVGYLYHNYNIKEFHIFDDVFNLDIDRVKNICQLILESKLKVSFAFPNGLRIDIMNEEIIALLRKIGTYKINYAVETVNQNIQKTIEKKLQLEKVNDVVYNTNKSGIITTGYFMLGFPGETKGDMLQTIRFAVDSEFDLAYFFKVTAFPGTEIFKSIMEGKFPQPTLEYYMKTYFYSRKNSIANISTGELNKLILDAQRKFYLKPKRILYIILKSPYKLKTLKSLFILWIKILMSFIEISLSNNDKFRYPVLMEEAKEITI